MLKSVLLVTFLMLASCMAYSSIVFGGVLVIAV
jgi:hypothetical protein